MSELVGEYAFDYISMGKNTKERQNYLNGACAAWNIAVFPEHLREGLLRRVIDGYKRINPGVDDADNAEQALRALIKRKLEMFPDIKKVIMRAMIEPISDQKFRIHIASTDERGLLKHFPGRGP